MNIQKLDPHQRAEEKRLQRNQDIIDLMSGRFSQTELQKRNSMFSGIDWSEVEIFEPNGYSWKPAFAVKHRA
jgi:hypothetical protein